MDKLQHQKFLSTSQAAGFLNVSRISIFRWIKNGTLKATKVGRNYVITQEEILKHLHKKGILTDESREEIKKLVDKSIRDYGETIRMLGGE